jgi:xylitol oxidase
MGFTPSAGKELQAEYFVPRKHAVEAILAVERLHDQAGPALFITEIRTIAADKLWMSPGYERDCVAAVFFTPLTYPEPRSCECAVWCHPVR